MERESGPGSGAARPQGAGAGDAVGHDHGARLQHEVLRCVGVHVHGAEGLGQAVGEDQGACERAGADQHAPVAVWMWRTVAS